MRAIPWRLLLLPRASSAAPLVASSAARLYRSVRTVAAAPVGLVGRFVTAPASSSNGPVFGPRALPPERTPSDANRTGCPRSTLGAAGSLLFAPLTGHSASYMHVCPQHRVLLTSRERNLAELAPGLLPSMRRRFSAAPALLAKLTRTHFSSSLFGARLFPCAGLFSGSVGVICTCIF